ncbi:unnamed protein product [Adineta steineri]|uniref:Uncharacterized protein n=1 Tax=Adineta steineri TaxID=433720 RepID=A0A819IJW9_9BILA|nr:unnamed protein product [Adineta steineri]CAF3917669.1 unnamed protein product [Adineta steineri]
MYFFLKNDLAYVQYVISLGNHKTFHPDKLEYVIFNIETDRCPINLFLHGLFLKKLWWVKFNKENLFDCDQIFHDIRKPELICEKKSFYPFDPIWFRSLIAALRVVLHNITGHLFHHTDDEPCPIAFCERLCFEMTTDLDETRLQINKTNQHLSTGCLQLSGLSIRGHAMLSHEGLPPERKTLEYAWQIEIILRPVHVTAYISGRS